MKKYSKILQIIGLVSIFNSIISMDWEKDISKIESQEQRLQQYKLKINHIFDNSDYETACKQTLDIMSSLEKRNETFLKDFQKNLKSHIEHRKKLYIARKESSKKVTELKDKQALEEYKIQINSFFRKYSYEIACQDSVNLISSLELKDKGLFNRIGKGLEDYINHCKELYYTMVIQTKEKEYKSNIDKLIGSFENEIKNYFSKSEYSVAYDNALEYIKIGLAKNDFLKDAKDRLMSFLEKCKIDAIDLEKKRIETKLDSILKTNTLNNIEFESSKKEALTYFELELDKNKDLAIFKDDFFNFIEKYKDESFIEKLKKEAYSSQIQQIENQIKNLFQEEIFDEASKKSLNLLNVELEKNQNLTEFNIHFLNFIEECKNNTLNLKIKQIKNTLENIFKNQEYELACSNSLEFINDALTKNPELKCFKNILINFNENYKKDTLDRELDKIKDYIIEVFKNNTYDKACKLASEILVINLFHINHLSIFKDILINFKNECKKQALELEKKKVQDQLENFFNKTDYKDNVKKASAFLTSTLIANKDLKEFESELTNSIQEHKKKALILEKKKVEAKLESIFKNNSNTGKAFNEAAKYLNTITSSNQDLREFEEELTDLNKELNRKALLTNELKKILDDYNQKNEIRAMNLLNAGANPNILVRYYYMPTWIQFLTETQVEDILAPAILKSISLKATNLTQALINNGVDLNSQDKNGMTALMLAIAEKNTYAIDKLLEYKVDLDIQNKDGQTALMAAILLNALNKNNPHMSFNLIKKLIDNGATLNIKDNEGTISLLYAIEKTQDKALIELLIDKGADINCTNNLGITPLMLACIINEKEITELLLKRGAKMQIDTIESIPTLILASVESNKEIVKLLLEYGANVDIQDDSGSTPLIAATAAGRDDIVEILLKYGANTNIQNKDGYTALICASIQIKENNVQIPIIKNLLSYGADLNIKCKEEISASDILNYYKHNQLIKNITHQKRNSDKAKLSKLIKSLENKNDINIIIHKIEKFLNNKHNNQFKDTFKRFIKIYLKNNLAKEYSKLTQQELDIKLKETIKENIFNRDVEEKIIRLILAGANPNLEIEEEPLLLKITKSYYLSYSLIKWLLFYDVNVSTTDCNRYNALIACINNTTETHDREKIINILITSSGIDIDWQDKEGYTALMIAVLRSDSNTVKLLLKKNADINIKTYQGTTALKIAINWAQNEYLPKYQIEEYKSIWISLLGSKKLININDEFEDESTIFIWAAKNNYLELVELILDNPQLEINAQDEKGYTALMYAIEYGSDYTEDESEDTREIKKSYQEIAKSILESEMCNIRRNKRNRTLIDQVSSITKDNLKIDINVEDQNGENALLKAIKKDHKQITDILLNYISSKNNILNKINLKEALINYKFKDDGSTILMHAVSLGKQWAVKKLLALELIDLHSEDNSGLSALTLAKGNKSTRHIAVLIREAIKKQAEKEQEEASYLKLKNYAIYNWFKKDNT